jgi:transcriptional regulator with XRE-family HTH domain
MPGRGDLDDDLWGIGALVQREFGGRLKRVRREKGMKQMTLGNRLGLSRTSISNIERGDQRVALELAYQVAHILGVSLRELLPTLEEVTPSEGTRVLTASDRPLVSGAEEEVLKVVFEVQKHRRPSRVSPKLKRVKRSK